MHWRVAETTGRQAACWMLLSRGNKRARLRYIGTLEMWHCWCLSKGTVSKPVRTDVCILTYGGWEAYTAVGGRPHWDKTQKWWEPYLTCPWHPYISNQANGESYVRQSFIDFDYPCWIISTLMSVCCWCSLNAILTKWPKHKSSSLAVSQVAKQWWMDNMVFQWPTLI